MLIVIPLATDQNHKTAWDKVQEIGSNAGTSNAETSDEKTSSVRVNNEKTIYEKKKVQKTMIPVTKKNHPMWDQGQDETCVSGTSICQCCLLWFQQLHRCVC